MWGDLFESLLEKIKKAEKLCWFSQKFALTMVTYGFESWEDGERN